MGFPDEQTDLLVTEVTTNWCEWCQVGSGHAGRSLNVASEEASLMFGNLVLWFMGVLEEQIVWPVEAAAVTAHSVNNAEVVLNSVFSVRSQLGPVSPQIKLAIITLIHFWRVH